MTPTKSMAFNVKATLKCARSNRKVNIALKQIVNTKHSKTAESKTTTIVDADVPD